MLRKAHVLLSTIDNRLDNVEYNTSTISGVRNLSVSDLQIIKMYCEEYIKSHGLSFGGLSSPRGYVKDVLDANNIVPQF